MEPQNGKHPDPVPPLLPARRVTTLATARAQGLAAFVPDEREAMLQPSPNWSRAILWTLVGVTVAGVAWALLAQTEEAVRAVGKLEPRSAVAEVQSPVAGVVGEVLVREGQQVQAGQVLLRLDPTAARAQSQATGRVLATLKAENTAYRAAMANQPGGTAGLPPEQRALAQSRAALGAENALYRAQLGRGASPVAAGEGRERFEASQDELASRVGGVRLERDQARSELARTTGELASARELLVSERQILRSLEVLVNEGGLARLQYQRQIQQVQVRQAEVARLERERERLGYALAQQGEKIRGTLSQSRADLLGRIADNEKRIAEIDGQWTRIMAENSRRVAELESQLSQAALTLRYQKLSSPVAGTVFDLQARSPGFVAQPSAPLLKVVPSGGLVAEVHLTNRDIGFVRAGMPVDVRVESYPFGEFGAVAGVVERIGSDALPPDPAHPYYRFPTRIRLERQTLEGGGRVLGLQSGMAVEANILVRKRSVASLFTELFLEKTEGLKQVR